MKKPIGPFIAILAMIVLTGGFSACNLPVMLRLNNTVGQTSLPYSSANPNPSTSPSPQSPLTQPAGLVATPANAQVTLIWNSVAGAIKYKVFYRLGATAAVSDTAATSAMISGTVAVITGLSNSSQYAFIVVASNLNGDGPASAPIVATPLSALPVGDKISSAVGLFKPVPGGTFFNGSANVTVTSFWMKATPVTQAQYMAVTGLSNPSVFNSDTSRPVEYVSWYSALAFCNLLSMQEGLTPAYTIGSFTDPAAWGSQDATWDSVSVNLTATGYRLATEAEWKWAAMGGLSDGLPSDIVGGINTGGYLKGYSGSSEAAGGQVNIGNYVWFGGNSNSSTQPVGTKLPNELGLYDISGNISCWLWDWYTSTPPTTAQTDPTGPVSGTSRIDRGGAYDAAPTWCIINSIDNDPPTLAWQNLGFRVVRR